MTTAIQAQALEIFGRIGIRGRQNREDLAALFADIDVLTPQVDTPVNAVAASGVVTFSGTPVADETITIDGNIFTFVAARVDPFEITIDADNTVQGDELVTAITADLVTVTAVNDAGAVTITAATKGVVGNLITLSESATGTAVSSVTAGKLDGGVDGTVGVANELRANDTYLYYTIAANTIADANWRRIAVGAVY